ncbi:N-acetylglucosamine/diacetylchitobiose ABC transporter substrate-binding protein [Allokutzneria sp. NRRL B-24872]|uniref:N-acetylglucosamine/diacetylchitobiose ABC transporter substrate-binding protein n=1 Tax=Allokutzneria sp. NRRL B-24872 TaxID=1137961 RepID=UPI000A38FC32|nr:N-acetylglucosamine/diacetylchitobiose ABC transporter substrate-binding protein [Allokutzneria sp. NRRL B-24872]
MNPTTRRSVLRGALAAAATPLLAGCVTGGGGEQGAALRGEVTKDNPLGVAEGAPLEVVIFKGAYGDQYALDAEKTYNQRHPQAKITHQGLQKVGEALQPRFVAGTPPDVVDNTGAGELDLATLVKANQVADLTELLDAPSLHDPSLRVRDTLLPGVVDDGMFNGRPRALNLVMTAWGVWYSRTLFAERGWSYPKTWDEMFTLCGEIKKSGIAPWTHQGKYPDYMGDLLVSMAFKAGGNELLLAVDHLEPNAWKHEAMIGAANAIAELVGRGYVMPGSEGLSHTEAQAAWSQGKAAFLPCGSWLEIEQQAVTPKNFQMAIMPPPQLSTSDKMPAVAVRASGAESFIVPEKARNRQGGMDFLRTMFAVPSARRFAELGGGLPSVKGATDGLTLSPGVQSVRSVIDAAGDNAFRYRFRFWYGTLKKAWDDATGELVAGRLSAQQWADRLQRAADAVARDPNITKYRR